MTWTDHVIWWHVYPLGFTGAPIRPSSDAERALTHRLGHLTGWLDHVVELGCNGLLLGPVFDSQTHGYDTLDFFRIDPRLGDDTDFDGLVAGARARGVRLLLDGVFNHVGQEHPLVRAAMASPDAPENALFRIDWSSGEPRPADFEGHGSLVALNHDSDAVVDLVADVMLHWLRRGIDGWRLDAAYAVPAEFWAKVLPRVRAEFGEAWILGEMIHGDYAGYVQASGLDSVTQYELWKATWSSLHDGNFFELDHALTRHNALLEVCAPNTFVGNHDVTRIATRVGPKLAVLAATILFTVGGVPSVYYGDEEGFTGTKREDWGGDDDVRPYLPVRPEELSTLGAGMRRVYQDLIAVRRQHPWLIRARVEQVELTNTRLVYDAVGEGGEKLRVELDAEDATARISRDGVQLWEGSRR
ncbi:MAG: alpha-amylase family protein [Propionibacteriaceae bacterium]|nr:alpha-amylase family protein [Propionibacteriaceae bacterium]